MSNFRALPALPVAPSTMRSHSMIQLCGRVSKSPSSPDSAVNVKSRLTSAGNVPASPLVLKFRLKS